MVTEVFLVIRTGVHTHEDAFGMGVFGLRQEVDALGGR